MTTLVIRPGAIGDCIVSLPAIDSIAADYKEVWVPSAIVPLIRRADRVDSIARTGLDLAGLPGVAPPDTLMRRLRSFDRIVSWYGANRDGFRAAMAALPFEFHAALPDGAGHAVDFFLAQLGLPPGAIPSIPADGVTRGRYIAIHAFSGGAKKNWPLEQYRELAARLPDVRFCAGPDEPLNGAVRYDSLGEVARWLAGARLYIGNDSGISHLAAAVGVPVIAIFGPTDPRVWAPRGLRVEVLSKPSVEGVYNAACAMLE